MAVWGGLQGWVQDPVTIRVGPQGQVPAGLQHRYMIVDDARKLIVMCRQLRLDLRQCVPAKACTLLSSHMGIV
jgi:hypothetical protein